MTTLTSTELQVIADMREIISEQELNIPEQDKTDRKLVGWLRAQGLNVKKAVEMLQKSLEWRKSIGYDKILEWEPPPHFFNDYPYQIPGLDREGHPVVIIPWGNWDANKATKNGEKLEFQRYMAQVFVKTISSTRASSVRFKQEITQGFLILDYSKFSVMHHFGSPSKCLRLLEGNFPELFYQIWLINCSKLMLLSFTVIKACMSDSMGSMLKLMSGPDEWKPKLFKYISPAELPVEYGGTQ